MKNFLAPYLTPGLSLALALFFQPALAADDHGGHTHQAHQHGVAHVDIALQDQSIAVSLQSPAANIVGFEHAPETEQQHRTLEQAKQKLQRLPLFKFVGADNCQMEEFSIESGLDDHGHDGHDGHADFEADFRYSCDTRYVSAIEFELFEIFPGIERIRVQFIRGTTQGASHLSKENRVLHF